MSEPMSPEQQRWIEENKLAHDTLNQLVTISSASIVILIAVMEKLLAPPMSRWLILAKLLIGISFVLFFTCIGLSLSLMKHISLKVAEDPGELFRTKYRHKYKWAKWSFLSAVSALVVFMIANLLLR